MKKIKLPYSYRIDISKLDKDQKFGSAVLHPLVETINSNRLEVINAGNELENRFNDIIKFFFFGNNVYKSVKRDLFEPMILGKSWFTLNAKKNLIIEIMNYINIPKGKEKQKFEQDLRKFIDARNIFAHGHLTIVKDLNVELGYFHGDTKSIILNDDYFDSLKSTIDNCFSYTEEISKHLKVGFWQQNEKESY